MDVNQYSKGAIKFNSFVDDISKLVEEYVTKEIGKGTEMEIIKDGIYNIFTNQDFDGKSFDFIFNSAKIGNPQLTKTGFMKQFIKTKVEGSRFPINLFDNIDNNATTDRVFNRLVKNVGAIQDRADRLKLFREKKLTDMQSLSDVERTIGTIGTRSKNIQSEYIAASRGLRNTPTGTPERTLQKNKVNDLRVQMMEEKKIYRTLKSDHDKLIARKDNLPKATFEKKYSELLVKVEDDLRTRQIPFEIKQTVKSSAGEPVKTTAKTEQAKATTVSQIKKAKLVEDTMAGDETMMVTIELNPNRTWLGHDICDDITSKDSGWGKGVYKYEGAKLPPYHPNCGCSFTISTETL